MSADPWEAQLVFVGRKHTALTRLSLAEALFEQLRDTIKHADELDLDDASQRLDRVLDALLVGTKYATLRWVVAISLLEEAGALLRREEGSWERIAGLCTDAGMTDIVWGGDPDDEEPVGSKPVEAATAPRHLFSLVKQYRTWAPTEWLAKDTAAQLALEGSVLAELFAGPTNLLRPAIEAFAGSGNAPKWPAAWKYLTTTGLSNHGTPESLRIEWAKLRRRGVPTP